MSSREKAISFMINLRSCYGQSFYSFLFFFFFERWHHRYWREKKIALLFTYRKIMIIIKSVELEHTPSSFPQSKRWSATVQSQKKKKGSSRRIYSCFFTHNGITTSKTTREGQESTTKTRLHLAWPPKFKNQVLFTPRARSRFLNLGLLLRGCRPKSRSLPGRVEVIQPVARACTTFWLTSTRITLTRVHRVIHLWNRFRTIARKRRQNPYILIFIYLFNIYIRRISQQSWSALIWGISVCCW